jgi:hypothetical protein
MWRTAMNELKQIALELLEKYRQSERSMIWEYSGNIRESERLLEEECREYKKRIEECM